MWYNIYMLQEIGQALRPYQIEHLEMLPRVKIERDGAIVAHQIRLGRSMTPSELEDWLKAYEQNRH